MYADAVESYYLFIGILNASVNLEHGQSFLFFDANSCHKVPFF